MPVLHLHGKRAIAGFEGCGAVGLVVASAELPRDDPACLILDPETLRATGAVAIYLRQGSPRIVTARDQTGDRLWSGWRGRAAPQLEWPLPDRTALNAKGRPESLPLSRDMPAVQ